jgi:outer membrane protein assembly factor BamD
MTAFGRAGLALLIVVGVACSSGGGEDPLMVLSSAEALATGKELLEQGKYRLAREYLVHAFEVDPNSVGGREALLLSADAYYLDGGSDNYLRAESKYRDFQTRFPTSERAAYVQFQIANALAKRMERPDRDQTNSRKAREEYIALIELYPTSRFVQEARDAIVRVRQNLADHEFVVGHFYYRYRNYNGAVQRFEGMLEDYSDFERIDEVLYFLGMTYVKNLREDDARATFDRLSSEYPDSPFVSKIPHLDTT